MPPSEPALRKFGSNVRSRREALDLSQEQLAEKADLDRTYISGVERGVRNLSLLSAARLAKTLVYSVANTPKSRPMRAQSNDEARLKTSERKERS
jgi:transcriptional regulator with XRE-family HTH domain